MGSIFQSLGIHSNWETRRAGEQSSGVRQSFWRKEFLLMSQQKDFQVNSSETHLIHFFLALFLPSLKHSSMQPIFTEHCYLPGVFKMPITVQNTWENQGKALSELMVLCLGPDSGEYFRAEAYAPYTEGKRIPKFSSKRSRQCPRFLPLDLAAWRFHHLLGTLEMFNKAFSIRPLEGV